MADFSKDCVKFQNKEVEIIKVIFALAFNLNLSGCIDSIVEVDKKSGYSSNREVPFYRMTLGFKTYFLTIDKHLNIAGADTSDLEKSAPSDFKPISNQLKIALFLINNSLIPDLIKENLEVV